MRIDTLCILLARAYIKYLRISQGKFICFLGDYLGLGNRLKCMASYHLSYGLNDTVIIWGKAGWVSSGFKELFTIHGVPNLRILDLGICDLMNETYPRLKSHGIWRLHVEEDEVDAEFMIQRDGIKFPAIDFRYSDIPRSVQCKYLQFFRLIAPSAKVQNRIREVNLDRTVVSVHVRNPVDEKDRKIMKQVPSISWFKTKMAEYPSNVRFFISTMHRSFSDELRAEFPGRIIELPNKNYNSMVDATADMFLLGMTDHLIVSPGSTFSEVAWWLGGCRQHVITATATG